MTKLSKDNSLSYTDIQIVEKIDRNVLFSSIFVDIDLPPPVKKGSRPPKPCNTFIIFRRYLNCFVRDHMTYDGRNLSRVAAYIWRNASKSERAVYEKKYELLKKQHGEMNPNYVETRKRKYHNNLNIIDCSKNYVNKNMERKRASCRKDYKQINRQINETNSVYTSLTQEPQEQANPLLTNYNPILNEYGNMDGAIALFFPQQQQDCYYYGVPGKCQTFYTGDANAGFN
ncbi:hypothetical protein RclHR1_13230001 [Rhizophagus clarus]|uniref:HMG (High mobility group) box protein n=1 Tax=Rhizophagus clarus TaxID=94130 RepID=A0A2Z6QBB4_9GLOM|nr:hypothetical protein RclHR1_13230001 [Rhizophagus clarus]GET03804.1 HMG (high mobility group) box protein [Rhizophagus clarus]